MTRAIYKYEIPLMSGTAEIFMPPLLRVVHAGVQAGVNYVWCEVDPYGVQKPRQFRVLATGEYLDDEAFKHAATIFYDVFVWHLYLADEA